MILFHPQSILLTQIINRVQGTSSAPNTNLSAPRTSIRFHARKSKGAAVTPSVLGPRRRPVMAATHIGTMKGNPLHGGADGTPAHAPLGHAGSSVALGVNAVNKALSMTSPDSSSPHDHAWDDSMKSPSSTSIPVTAAFRWRIVERFLAFTLPVDLLLTTIYLAIHITNAPLESHTNSEDIQLYNTETVLSALCLALSLATCYLGGKAIIIESVGALAQCIVFKLAQGVLDIGNFLDPSESQAKFLAVLLFWRLVQVLLMVQKLYLQTKDLAPDGEPDRRVVAPVGPETFDQISVTFEYVSLFTCCMLWI
jgi:hypothetical protein